MAQHEQFATPGISAREGSTSGSRMAVPIVLFVAAAFAANAWFFYRQGQRDGANSYSEATPFVAPGVPAGGAAAPAVTAEPSSGDAAMSSTNSAPASTAGEAAKPDAAGAGKSAPQSAAKAKPAHRLAAKTVHPVSSAPANPYERQARLALRPVPAYPPQALRAREQGTVLVLAQVDVGGRVSDARVARRSGSTTLDRAAMNEVRHWKFEPALHNGRPVMASVEVPVSYRLGE